MRAPRGSRTYHRGFHLRTQETSHELVGTCNELAEHPNTAYHNTIATVFRGDALDGRIASTRKRHTRVVLAIQGDPPRTGYLVICFSDEDYKGISP
ncbi:hypothetical protein CR513_12314, partial [Mucuna pruriens]